MATATAATPDLDKDTRKLVANIARSLAAAEVGGGGQRDLGGDAGPRRARHRPMTSSASSAGFLGAC